MVKRSETLRLAGAMQSVRLLKTIKGNEIEAIIRAYATGAEYVNIGTSTYYLKIKDE